MGECGHDAFGSVHLVLTMAVGAVLPAAVAVALSPIPIVAVVLMLGTPKAKANGTAFAAGWVAGLSAVSVVVLLISRGSSDPDSATATGANWLEVGFGVLFLVMAARKWSGRPGKGEEPEMPTWMSAIDSFTPRRSLLLGAALSAANPKNLVLTSAAAASIAQAGLSGGQDSIAIAIFVAIGSVTVVGAVGCYLVAPDRAARPLDSIRAFMAEHNNVIMRSSWPSSERSSSVTAWVGWPSEPVERCRLGSGSQPEGESRSGGLRRGDPAVRSDRIGSPRWMAAANPMDWRRSSG